MTPRHPPRSDPAGQLPAGPGDALVIGVEPVLRGALGALGWTVRTVAAPAGDLAGFGVGLAERSVDLVAVDCALTPLNHPDKRAAIATITRWIRPGGLLLLREPAAGSTRTGLVGTARSWVRRTFRIAAEATHGPATHDFYATACRHVGFDITEIIPEPTGGIEVLVARQAGRDENLIEPIA